MSTAEESQPNSSMHAKPGTTRLTVLRPLLFAAGLLMISSIVEGTARAQTLLTDLSGDSSAGPDVVSVSAGYDASYLYLSAEFRVGTLNPASFGFVFDLDVDQNPLTGMRYAGGPYGVDYWVYFNSEDSLTTASVKFMTSPYPLTGTVLLTVGQDQISTRVPLALLGNDDGIMNFGFACGLPYYNYGITIYDTAPDGINIVSGKTLTTATTPVPEPQSLLLGVLAVSACWLGKTGRQRSRRRERG
jgi:hypothetical protein